MKKAVITQFSHAEVDAKAEPFGFMKIPQEHTMIRAEGEELSVSDGYHTFEELYDHRITLFIALCRTLVGLNKISTEVGKEAGVKNPIFPIWKSWEHADGSRFDGWFIMGIFTEKGKQISYHLPADRWEACDFAEFRHQAPEWDGHTPADVIERLKQI